MIGAPTLHTPGMTGWFMACPIVRITGTLWGENTGDSGILLIKGQYRQRFHVIMAGLDNRAIIIIT